MQPITTKKDQFRLSDREREVLFLAAEGLTDKEIASRLNIGPKTVRTYWDRMRHKLNAASRTQALATALRGAYEELAESEGRLRRFLDVMPLMLFAFDENFRVIDMNAEAQDTFGEVTGVEAAELFRRLADDPFSPDPVGEAWQKTQTSFRNVLSRSRRRTGDPVVTSWSSTSTSRSVPGWHSWTVAVDMENVFCQPLSVQETLGCAVRSRHVGVWLLDAELKGAFANDEMARLLGVEVPDLLGATPLPFIAEEDVADVVGMVQAGVAGTLPFRFVRRDGSRVEVIKSFKPLRNAAGQIAWYLVTVTERTADETESLA